MMKIFHSHTFQPLTRMQVAQAPERFHTWLQNQSSLTQRLIKHSQSQFEVQVLSECMSKIGEQDCRLLGVRRGSLGLVREVNLLCHGQACVYAKSIIPIQALVGWQRRLLTLGNLPLGQFLFSSPYLKRHQVDILPLTTEHDSEQAWGRRTRFDVQYGSVLVSEYFLPELVDKN